MKSGDPGASPTQCGRLASQKVGRFLLCACHALVDEPAKQARVTASASVCVVFPCCFCTDSAAASFAGQFDTVLNVPGSVEAVGAAIKSVWASQWSDHVLAYTAKHGGPFKLPGMAVVIQRMVAPVVCSGVLFTVNPTAAGTRVALPQMWLVIVVGCSSR